MSKNFSEIDFSVLGVGGGGEITTIFECRCSIIVFCVETFFLRMLLVDDCVLSWDCLLRWMKLRGTRYLFLRTDL